MSYPQITEKVIDEHGLTLDEYHLICHLLGRSPRYVELGMFSVMWSEHCSYKSSKPLLKTLPTEGDSVLVEAGEENAGAIDIGDGWAVVFKIESHNHPSAVDPVQGAATGVGGILRDIFTMGARPLVLMDSLRFGFPLTDRQKYLLSHVVEGISFYGNCVGVPTMGGELVCDSSYDDNPLVNVFCLGLVKKDNLIRGSASHVGALVFYVGSPTGRDGIHGATFASEDLTDESQECKSAVQVGDPFMEKCLLEACLEVMDRQLVLGVQDMGAAGLTCAISEMASRGRQGIRIVLDKVPQREEGMSAYEILLSESQERMMCVVEAQSVELFKEVFERWEVPVEQIGEVLSSGKIDIFHKEELVASLPLHALTDEAPIVQLKGEPSIPSLTVSDQDIVSQLKNKPFIDILKRLLVHPEVASKQDVYEQYDHMVQTHTILPPGHDATVLRVKGTSKAIACSLDGHGYYCYVDPYRGAYIAVMEATRNLACVGACPIGVTNCLNFGNPYEPAIYAQMQGVVSGLGDACRDLSVPITGGNVSLYNQSIDQAVFPTLVVGVVGLIDDWENTPPPFQYFTDSGQKVYLLGRPSSTLGSSLVFRQIESFEGQSPLPYIDSQEERNLHQLLILLIQKRVLSACHDCSIGGALVALSEMCFSPSSRLGFKGRTPVGQEEFLWPFWLGEDQGRAIVAVREDKCELFESMVQSCSVPFHLLGVTTESLDFIIEGHLSCSVEELFKVWRYSLRKVWDE